MYLFNKLPFLILQSYFPPSVQYPVENDYSQVKINHSCPSLLFGTFAQLSSFFLPLFFLLYHLISFSASMQVHQMPSLRLKRQITILMLVMSFWRVHLIGQIDSISHFPFPASLFPQPLTRILHPHPCRFAQFFISPLFTPSGTERELNAVDSEFRRNFPEDSRRSYQIEKHLSNPRHSFNRFGTGSAT